jgi:hypothetical protein
MNTSHNLTQVALRAIAFARAEKHRDAAKYRRLYRRAVEQVESNPVLNTTFQISITIGAIVGITVVLFIASIWK